MYIRMDVLDTHTFRRILEYCGASILDARSVCRKWHDFVESADTDFWRVVNARTWVLSWDMYDPNMLTTLRGFIALVYCWNELHARIQPREQSMKFIYGTNSKLYCVSTYIMPEMLIGDDKTMWFLVMSIFPRTSEWLTKFACVDDTAFVRKLSRYTLTRETVMYLQPAKMQLSLKEITQHSPIASLFLLYRIRDRVLGQSTDVHNTTCTCGQCDVTFGEIARMMEEIPMLANISKEDGVLPYAPGDIRFTTFVNYSYPRSKEHLVSFRRIIMAYLSFYTWSTQNMPNSNVIDIFTLCHASIYPRKFVHAQLQAVYDLLCKFRTIIGETEWLRTIGNSNGTRCAEIFGQFFDAYAKKEW
jgi:hypothetical protein